MSFNDDCKKWFKDKGLNITFHKRNQRYYATVKILESTKDWVLEQCKNDTYKYISNHVKHWYPDSTLTSYGGDKGTFFLYTFESLLKDEVKTINQLEIENAMLNMINNKDFIKWPYPKND